MDNASFHKRQDIQEAVTFVRYPIEYPPVYSPRLNSVEHKWARRNHIEPGMQAFSRLEYRCFVKGISISRFEAKISIIRNEVRAYLAKPIYTPDFINFYATRNSCVNINYTTPEQGVNFNNVRP